MGALFWNAKELYLFSILIMQRIIQYSFLVLILCFSIEVAFKLKYYQDKLFFPSNAITPSEKYLELWDSLSNSANAEKVDSKKLFLIGDSFFDAEENGGADSYVPYFTQFSLQENWDFFNLSLAGTDINDHKNIWDQIKDHPNNTYVFSIKIHDLGKINSNNTLTNNGLDNSNEVSFKSKLIALISKSELIYLMKDILHQFYMLWKNTPAPFTHLHKVMVTPSEADLLQLSKFLNSLDEKKGFVIVLVNYPYNFKYYIKQLSQSRLYHFFNNQNISNLKIFQSPLITNKKESVDWRNVHPNSTSMKEVFNFIKQEILNKNERANPSSAKTKTSPAQ